MKKPHLLQKAKEKIERFFLIDDTPHKIAGGFATGIFFGMMPSEGVLTTLFVSSLLRFNSLSATIGVFSFNAWSTFVALPLAAAVGGYVFQISPQLLINNFKETYTMGLEHFFTKTIFFEILTPFFIGYFIVSLTVALFFYFVLYVLLKHKKLRLK